MIKQADVWTKLGFSAVFALVLGLSSWWQYSKYVGGRGVARWLVPLDATPLTLVLVFVLLPLAVALALGWTVAKDQDRRPGA